MKWFSRSRPSLSAALEKALSTFCLCPACYFLTLPDASCLQWCFLMLTLFRSWLWNPVTLAPLFLSSAFISFGVLLPFLAWWDAPSFLYLLWPIWRISHFSKEFLFNWGWWKLGCFCMGLLIQDDLKRLVKPSFWEKTEERALTPSHFLWWLSLLNTVLPEILCGIGIIHARVYTYVQAILTVCANT